MQRRLISGALALLFALSMSVLSSAQAQKKQTFTFIPHADLEALMKTSGDHPARVIDVEKKMNLGAYLLHFDPRPPNTTLNGWLHNDISEVYYVIRGSGTALVGGEMENATWDDSNSDAIRQVRGPSVNGTMKNYKTVKWTAGDTFIVPAGVPHSMGFEVTERSDMLRVVFDPRKNIQLK